MRESKRYLGLELAGAKNQKTSLAALEFYPKEQKIFLLDIFDHIAPHDHQTGDEALLEVIQEITPAEPQGISKMGVNVPLELPPCISCKRKTCPLPASCTVKPVKWMREFTRKTAKRSGKTIRVKDFTPYTQRPIELWIRYELLKKTQGTPSFIPPFEIDETLGGNRAPLTARMHFLKYHFKHIPLVEVWPKLSIAILANQLDIPKRITSTYRHLEDGAAAREIILDHIAQQNEVFIYERDRTKLSQNLTAFDAFICAYTAFLSDQNLCVKLPKGFPAVSGWVQYPEVE